MATDAGSVDFGERDPIEPTRIEHKVDDIIVDGRIEQTYNFVDDWFDSPSGRLRARAYMDTSHSVAIYPPIEIEPGMPPQLGEDWSARDAVIRYLARRFILIKELGPEGYQPVWMAVHARRYLEARGLTPDD